MSNVTARISSVVNASRYVPQTSSLIVAVRVRPIIKTELARGSKRDIIRVLDGRVVVVLDPDETKDYLDQVQNRTKEKRYTFDIAFPAESSNEAVFNGTVCDLVGGVLQGINTTVFAYGATGSGKTYTMVGTPSDPGLMVQCLRKVFKDRDTVYRGEQFDVTCSYLEVYNEIVYDLLVRNSEPLELREDPEQGVQVAGIRRLVVRSADEILEALEEGNRRRKTESTDANQTSSRSHAVLEIEVKRRPTNNHYKVKQLVAKLSLVDLAGSERAAETNNAGQKLRDGANINKSLLALANCINALGKMQGNGKTSYVPYRNSKLTRLLKDGLSGNSRTAMIATVSASGDQYHHSINTLKYADRAKEIKTHVVQNVGTVETHITDYQRIIDNLQSEVISLKSQLNDRQKSMRLPAGGPMRREDDVLQCIDDLVNEMNENTEERINLQKALFEIEDANVYNRFEVKQLQEFIESGKGKPRELVDARELRISLLEQLGENEAARDRKKADISANEQERKSIQARIDALVNSNQNASFLNMLGNFRLQALRLQEQKFQMAVRDQIIGEQREVIGNLWKIINKSGMTRNQVLDIAHAEGIIMDDFFPPGDSDDEESAGRPPTVGASQHLLRKQQQQSSRNSSPSPQPPLHRDKSSSALIGDRAKLRYQFWSKYDLTAEDEAEMGSSPPGRMADGGGRPGIPAVRPRPRLHAAGHDVNNATAPPAHLMHRGRRSAIQFNHEAGVHHHHHRKRSGSRRATDSSGISGGGGAGHGDINNAAASPVGAPGGDNGPRPGPTRVKSGRRAGQPKGQSQSARGANPRQNPAYLSEILPPSQLPRAPGPRHRSSDGADDPDPGGSPRIPMHHVRSSTFSNESMGWQEALLRVQPPPRAPPPPPPPLQMPMSERLAKLKAVGSRRQSNMDHVDQDLGRMMLPPDALDREVQRIVARRGALPLGVS